MEAPLRFPAAFRWGVAAAHSGVACDHWPRVDADADLAAQLGHERDVIRAGAIAPEVWRPGDEAAARSGVPVESGG